jgi:hypothetical protein
MDLQKANKQDTMKQTTITAFPKQDNAPDKPVIIT